MDRDRDIDQFLQLDQNQDHISDLELIKALLMSHIDIGFRIQIINRKEFQIAKRVRRNAFNSKKQVDVGQYRQRREYNELL